MLSATRLTASAFGVLAGLGGLTHGVGEVLQGNIAAEGIAIDSWTEGPIATNMGGEPAFTVVPNILVTGILTLLISTAVLLWAASFPQRPRGGWILVLFSVAMLLVGGGVGPPVIGVLAGIAGTGIASPPEWCSTRVPPASRRLLARAWHWVFAVSFANGLFLVVGSVILVYTVDLNKPDLFTYSFLLAALSMGPATLAAFAFDLQARDRRLVVESPVAS